MAFLGILSGTIDIFAHNAVFEVQIAAFLDINISKQPRLSPSPLFLVPLQLLLQLQIPKFGTQFTSQLQLPQKEHCCIATRGSLREPDCGRMIRLYVQEAVLIPADVLMHDISCDQKHKLIFCAQGRL